MEKLIYVMDPVTRNLSLDVSRCSEAYNIRMGNNKWRKSLYDFTIPHSLKNRHMFQDMRLEGMSTHHLENTYAELVDVLPDMSNNENHNPYTNRRRERSLYLSPEIGSDCEEYLTNRESIPYWKYIRLYYKRKQYEWQENGGYSCVGSEDITFAVWGRDGRVRIAPSRMIQIGKGISLYNRLNALFGLSHHRSALESGIGNSTPYFMIENGMLRMVVPIINKQNSTRVRYYGLWRSHIPVIDGDIFDVKTNKLNSRILDGLPPMQDILSDISPNYSIPQRLRNQFRQAPNNPSVRSAIRAEINQVVPDNVTDEQGLNNFLSASRTIISEEGVYSL